MRFKTLSKGQGTLEYAIVIVVVVGALIAMQWYIKGGYQGKLRSSSDDMGNQFSPTKTTGVIFTRYNNSTQNDVTLMNTGVTTTNYDHNITKDGNETLTGFTGNESDQR
jgi:hypothetical protein